MSRCCSTESRMGNMAERDYQITPVLGREGLDIYQFTPHLCLLSSHFCLLSSHFCLLPSHFCLLSSHFCLLSSQFCLLSSYICLLSSHFCLLSSHFCLLSSHFCLLDSHLYLLDSHLLSYEHPIGICTCWIKIYDNLLSVLVFHVYRNIQRCPDAW